MLVNGLLNNVMAVMNGRSNFRMLDLVSSDSCCCLSGLSWYILDLFGHSGSSSSGLMGRILHIYIASSGLMNNNVACGSRRFIETIPWVVCSWRLVETVPRIISSWFSDTFSRFARGRCSSIVNDISSRDCLDGLGIGSAFGCYDSGC
mgnify:FL=1